MSKRAALFLGLAVAVAVAASPVAAHEYTISYSHLLKVAFPGTAQGKELRAVTAKVGIQAYRPAGLPDHPFFHPGQYGGTSFILGEKSVQLVRQGDHFFAKARLDATQYPGGAQLGAVKATYELTFTDGSTLLLRDQYVTLERQHNLSSFDTFNAKLAEELGLFNAVTDARASTVVSLSVYSNGTAW